MAGMQNGTLGAAATCGDSTITLAATPTNLKPGVGIIIGVTEWNKVALTYTGSSTTVPLAGVMRRNHNSGATVQWDPNAAPGLTGS